MNFFDIACTIEEQGYQYYQKLAKEVQPKEVADIFLTLAREEKKHFIVFQALKNNQPKHTSEIPATDIEDIFHSIVNNTISVEKTQYKYTEALDIALNLEKKSIATFEHALTTTKKHADKEILSQILAEEKKHVWLITSMKEYHLNPDEWRENPMWYSA